MDQALINNYVWFLQVIIVTRPFPKDTIDNTKCCQFWVLMNRLSDNSLILCNFTDINNSTKLCDYSLHNFDKSFIPSPKNPVLQDGVVHIIQHIETNL